MAKMAAVDGTAIENLFKKPTGTKKPKAQSQAVSKPKAEAKAAPQATPSKENKTVSISLKKSEADLYADIMFDRKLAGLPANALKSATLMDEVVPPVLERISKGENIATSLDLSELGQEKKSISFSSELYQQILVALRRMQKENGASASEATVTNIVRAALQSYELNK